MSGFLNNSVTVYTIKLKIGILYHMSNTFWNTVFEISADVPLRKGVLRNFTKFHNVHWVISPPSQTPPNSFSQALPLLKSADFLVQAPLFRQFSLYIVFSWTPPPLLQIGFFSEPPYLSFSTLIPSHLLK